MNSYKMISAALLAGLMTACVVTDGSTDSITGISATDSTAGSTGGTGSSGDASTGGSTGGTGTGETATGSSGDVPTTDAPTSSSGTGSTSSASTSSTTGGGAMCGWNVDMMYYDCGFEGEDPSATFPIDCPDGLVEGDPCGAVKGEGCCDASGNNWYCGDNMGVQELVTVPCGG